MKDNNKFRLDVWGVITLVTIAVYALFLLYPMAHLVSQSVWDGKTGAFTLENFAKFFSKSYYLDTLFNSFKVSITATVLSLAIGTPLAYLFSIYKIRGKSVLNILIVVASMSAPFIGAYSWILLLGRSGVITAFFKNVLNITLPDIYGFGGIVLVMSLQLFPLVFLYARGAFKNVDNSLIEASQNLGCSGIKCFFQVVVPLIQPTLLAAALLVFMRSFADFGTPMLIGEGYRTFPVVLYTEFINEVGGNDGFAAAIAVIAIVITTVVFLIQKYISTRKSFSLNALHPMEAVEPKKAVKPWVYLFSYLIVGIAILPQAYVIYTSFKSTQGKIFTAGYSLASYQSAFGKLGSSIQNTIVIPMLALVVIVLLAILIAYLVTRRRNPVTNVVDVLSMIPYIVPGTVLGIALLTGFNQKPLLISGTMLIMVIALVIRRLPYTIRSSVAILQQIPMSIEEAAISLGASKMKAFFRVTVPMMAAGIVSGAILSWVTMISELSTAIILYTGRTKTLTVAIYTEVVRGNYGIAAALSTILTVLTVISLLIFNKVNGGKELSL
jgi:iron(III) transport system permease protein